MIRCSSGVTWIVYARSMVSWDTRNIYESFLVCIIPRHTSLIDPEAKHIQHNLPIYESNIFFNVSLYVCVRILTITSNSWSVRLEMVFPLLGGDNAGFPSGIHHILLWDFPHSEFRLCCTDFPSGSRLCSFVDGISPTQKQVQIRLCCRLFLLSEALLRSRDFFPLGGSICMYHRWDFPYSGITPLSF